MIVRLRTLRRPKLPHSRGGVPREADDEHLPPGSTDLRSARPVGQALAEIAAPASIALLVPSLPSSRPATLRCALVAVASFGVAVIAVLIAAARLSDRCVKLGQRSQIVAR